MVAALHSYTHPTWLRLWGSGSLVESKWCNYVKVDADSHLKLLPPSILDITKCLSTLICCQLAYSSSLTQLYPHSTAASTTSSVLLLSSHWFRLSSQLLTTSLCLHHHPHCAGIAVLVVLALLPLLCWCCCCQGLGLPHRPWLSTCQLNKGKDACKLTAQCKHNTGNKACSTRTLMPVHQGQQRQCDKGKDTSEWRKHASLTEATTPVQQRWQCPCDLRAKRSVWYRQQCQCNKGNNACAILAMAPAQQGQRYHCDNDKDTCALMMAMAPLWWGQIHQVEDGNGTITTRATTLLQQRQRCLDYKDSCTSTTATQLQWGQQHQLDNKKRRLCINDGNNPIVTRAMIPAWWLC